MTWQYIIWFDYASVPSKETCYGENFERNEFKMIKNSRFSQYLCFNPDSSYLLTCAGVVSIFLERRLCMTI